MNTICKCEIIENTELTDLQRRRLEVINNRQEMLDQREILRTAELRKFILSLMEKDKVQQLEQLLVENGYTYVDIDTKIGELRIDVDEEIKDLEKFWNAKGVEIKNQYRGIINNEFSLELVIRL